MSSVVAIRGRQGTPPLGAIARRLYIGAAKEVRVDRFRRIRPHIPAFADWTLFLEGWRLRLPVMRPLAHHLCLRAGLGNYRARQLQTLEASIGASHFSRTAKLTEGLNERTALKFEHVLWKESRPSDWLHQGRNRVCAVNIQWTAESGSSLIMNTFSLVAKNMQGTAVKFTPQPGDSIPWTASAIPLSKNSYST